MTHDATSTRLLCQALNRLFWKCPPPKRILDEATGDTQAITDWANYWLAELADGHARDNITGIYWDAAAEEFKPERRTS